MERTYIYDPYFYKNKVVVISYVMIGIFLYGLYRLIFQGISALWLIIELICLYSISNTFFTKSNPREIIVSDSRITFRSYGEKSFDISKLTLFRVRMVSPNYQLLVRVSDGDTSGKFWITYNYFNDKMDLLEEFNYLERKVHEGTLRMRGRDDMGACRPHERADKEAEGQAKETDQSVEKPASGNEPAETK